MMDRRSLLKGAAWTAPAILATVTAPALVASGPTDDPAVCGFAHQGNNGHYLVYSDKLVIFFNHAPDIYEVNVKGDGWQSSFGTNYGTAPERGSKTWVIALPKPAHWVQVHSISDHYGEVC